MVDNKKDGWVNKHRFTEKLWNAANEMPKDIAAARVMNDEKTNFFVTRTNQDVTYKLQEWEKALSSDNPPSVEDDLQTLQSIASLFSPTRLKNAYKLNLDTPLDEMVRLSINRMLDAIRETVEDVLLERGEGNQIARAHLHEKLDAFALSVNRAQSEGRSR